jgi:hypothetical protein
MLKIQSRHGRVQIGQAGYLELGVLYEGFLYAVLGMGGPLSSYNDMGFLSNLTRAQSGRSRWMGGLWLRVRFNGPTNPADSTDVANLHPRPWLWARKLVSRAA